MKTVLITRAEENSDNFASKLQELGFRTVISPLLQYKEIKNDYGDIEIFDALAFTSAEAVRIFAKNCKERKKQVFAVGDKCAAVAKDLGFANVVSAAGRAKDLEKLIKKHKIKNVLHLCGADTPKNPYTRRVIYKADALENLNPEATEMIKNHKLDYVVLLSANTAKAFASAIAKLDLEEYLPHLTAVFISGGAAEPLENIPFKQILIAERPNLDMVLRLLTNK